MNHKHNQSLGSKMLTQAIGRWWLTLTGWKRSYPLYGRTIDLANPYLHLAIQADGDMYKIDVVNEYETIEMLQDLGWHVRHYRYPMLKKQPAKVKRDIRHWFLEALILKIRS